MSDTLASFIKSNSLLLGDVEKWLTEETLLSFVYLGKDKVFKFKKPVRLSYVDQSTPELRFSLCQTELVTNQRFNAKDYLCIYGFFPDVSEQGETFRFKAVQNFDPDAIDFCIVINRLPHDLQWEYRLEKNLSISKEEIYTLCEKIHSHHLTSVSEQNATPWTVWDEALGRLKQFPQTFPENLVNPFQNCLSTQKPFLCKLVKKGFWREGHGDLRVDHIYSNGSTISLLDCVEFNIDYRITNAFEELAFLYLGFLFHNREDLGFLLLQSFFFFRPDPKSLELFYYFVWQKACVRWYVNSLKVEKNQIHIDIYEQMIKQLMQVIIANSKTSPQTQMLTLVIGLPGSGKTTKAKEIADNSRAFLISLDNLRKFSYRIPPFQEGSKLIYSSFRSRWIYRKALAIAKRVLEQGQSVIIDGTFLKQSHREPFLQLARGLGHQWQIEECIASSEETSKRLEARKREASISDLKDMSIWDRMRKEWEPVLQKNDCFTKI